MALKENKKLIENFGAYLHCLKKKKKKIRFGFGEETYGVQSLAFLF